MWISSGMIMALSLRDLPLTRVRSLLARCPCLMVSRYKPWKAEFMHMAQKRWQDRLCCPVSHPPRYCDHHKASFSAHCFHFVPHRKRDLLSMNRKGDPTEKRLFQQKHEKDKESASFRKSFLLNRLLEVFQLWWMRIKRHQFFFPPDVIQKKLWKLSSLVEFYAMFFHKKFELRVILGTNLGNYSKVRFFFENLGNAYIKGIVSG